MLSSKFDTFAKIQDIKISSGGKVTGRMTTSRKATDYDKNAYEGRVYSTWFIEFAGKTVNEDAKKLTKGTKITLPAGTDSWSVKNETFEDKDGKKKSYVVVTIFNWKYPDNASNRAPADSGVKEEEENPFDFE